MKKLLTFILGALLTGSAMSQTSPAKFDSKFLTNPESKYAPGYFWIINGVMDEAKMKAQLDEMVAVGTKSVCLHPFPKGFRPKSQPSEMSPDYLTPEYMDMMLKVMDHAEKLGMNAWLYDEGGWPSGNCLGRVYAANPKKFAHRIKVLKEDGTVEDKTVGGRSFMEPGTTEKFIQLTHEIWAEKCQKHFGKTINFAFTDEPCVWYFHPGKDLGWASDFTEYFKAKKGYDLTPHLPEIMADMEPSPEVAKMRIDYCDVKTDMFCDRYMLPLQKWCHEHNLLSAGHMNGEDEPHGNFHYGYGHILRSLRAMDVPGVDVIWRQLYPDVDNPPFCRYASSAAHHIGSKYVLAEIFGIYGDGMGPNNMKWLIDYCLVRGINTLVFGYYIYDPSKHFMASLNPNFHCNSIWDFMKPLNAYTTAVSSILGQGSPCAKIGVLYDIHAIWTGGKDMEQAIAKHFEVAKKMDKAQQDYDFIDDEQIAAATISQDGQLAIGPMTYDTIILPTSKWLTDAAKAKLNQFKQMGGKVLDGDSIAQARPTCHVTGSGKENLRVTKRQFADGVAAYFLVNESAETTVEAKIEFQENSPVARWNFQSNGMELLTEANGIIDWTFAPYESLLVFVGVKGDLPAFAVPEITSVKKLDNGWTLRKLEEYKAGKERLEHNICDAQAAPAELGDWRKYLGEDFSGKASYELTFNYAEDCDAILDLGRVDCCASVTLNGKQLQPLFFGPFKYSVKLKKGANKLAVTVANTMANALNNEQIKRIARDYPPASPYHPWALRFNPIDQSSGLFGPVVLKFCKR